MIKIGQKVKFKPLQDIKCLGVNGEDSITEGTVIFVHEEHRYFRVRYGKYDLAISFKFDDIGEKVFVVKE